MNLRTEHPADSATNLSASERRGPIGRVVVASLLSGAVGALVLTLAVFPGGTENQIIGSALLAFGAGWAILGLLSTRLTEVPQRWAHIPAAVMSLTGLAVLAMAPGSAAFAAAGWVWPVVLGVLSVWMGVSLRRALPGRAALLLYPVIALIGAAAVGGMVTNVQTRATADQYPMPGQAYDVNGHRLHLLCSGSGSPTVVLENGLGLSSPAWARITATVGSATRVCAYDRAGQGWSEAPTQPQDSRAVAADLHLLLQSAGEQGPFVLAAHSAGGAYAMTYAATYPDDVAGLVLLDSMSPHQFTLVPTYPAQYEMIRRLYGVLAPLSRVGLGPLLADAPADLPDLAAAQERAIQTRPANYDNARGEVSLYHQSLEQAQALITLGDMPLVVLTTTESITKSPGWTTAQDELAALSTNSSHRVVDTTHVGVLVTTAGSDASVHAITDVVDAVRTGDPVRGR
ncbi:alpha/beta fold hydrolase [Actinotalea sp.]|uniref:alpha/beta fold hydrolase n=1 Tax=Actinotalea sp. TaxID=1872145 RepID=UPI003565620A